MSIRSWVRGYLGHTASQGETDAGAATRGRDHPRDLRCADSGAADTHNAAGHDTHRQKALWDASAVTSPTRAERPARRAAGEGPLFQLRLLLPEGHGI